MTLEWVAEIKWCVTFIIIVVLVGLFVVRNSK